MERSIRHTEVEHYEDLFESLRKLVSVSITSNGARDNKRKRPLVKPNDPDDMDNGEVVNCDKPMYNAKTCLDFIPILNEQHHIGVEGFIKRVREARAE